MTTTKLTILPQMDGQRLDKCLPDALQLTRSAVQNLLDTQMVTVNGKVASKSYKVHAGEEIVVTLPDPEPCSVEPENIPLEIVYEDSDLLVVNKPKGMVVHPAACNPNGTLVNALLYHCQGSLSGINGVLRPGIVHRIDKDTSGLLIVAKNDTAHQGLAEQIKAHTFTRIYEAVACGHLKMQTGTLHQPIGRHPTHRKKMAVVSGGRDAVTHFTVIEEYRGYTHLKLQLETGRTHQIRVHMSHLGHPLAGDTVYGAAPDKRLQGQCLHARVIGFVHPVTGEYMEFSSDLPAYFQEFLTALSE